MPNNVIEISAKRIKACECCGDIRARNQFGTVRVKCDRRERKDLRRFRVHLEIDRHGSTQEV